MVRSACRRFVLPTPYRGSPAIHRHPWTFHRQAVPRGTMPLNKAAERALRGIALGRKAWLFAGSDRDGERAAAMTRSLPPLS
jgi:transposase